MMATKIRFSIRFYGLFAIAGALNLGLLALPIEAALHPKSMGESWIFIAKSEDNSGSHRGDSIVDVMKARLLEYLIRDGISSTPELTDKIKVMMGTLPQPSRRSENFQYFFDDHDQALAGALAETIYLPQTHPDGFLVRYSDTLMRDLGLEISEAFLRYDGRGYGGEDLYEIINPDPGVDLIFYISVIGTDVVGLSPTRSLVVIWGSDPRELYPENR